MKISVVTVTMNSAATLADTLRSVNAQTHPGVEHIVIDGGSTDATLDIVKAEGKRVATVVSEPDRGIYDAMNKGIRLTTGEVVGLINSDDFYASPEVLAKVAAVFADLSIDACYGDLCYVQQDDTMRVVRYWRSSAFEPGLFGRGWAPPHPTFFVRRSVLIRHGLFNLDYPIAADMELMARFIEVHRVSTRYVPEVFVHMRMGGISNRNLHNIIRQNYEILRALRSHGLNRSAAGFLFAKLLSRCKQFLSRPNL